MKILSTKESTAQRAQPTQHLYQETMKGMGQDTHTQTNGGRRPRRELKLTQLK